jgi:transposase
MHTTIVTLWKHGQKKAQISKQLGCDWKTVDNVISKYESGEPYDFVKKFISSLDKHKAIVDGFLERGLNMRRLHEELSDLDIKISYSAVKRYVAKIKGAGEVCIRFHTEPGKEAQVDFGYVGRFLDPNGNARKTYAFCMTLSYSRLAYVGMVFDQKVETFLKCHLSAFQYFGGVPQIVKIDNLKSGVIEASFYEPIMQCQYNSFAARCGFDPIPCRVRTPQEKGKIESGVKYVQSSFINGRKFSSYDDMEKQLKEWLDNKCNLRIHGTTNRKPRELFDTEEKSLLKALPEDIKISNAYIRRVQTDCHILIQYNYYSVPFKYVGKEVHVESDDKIVRIFYNNEQISVHEYLQGKGKFSTCQSHYPDYKLPANKEGYKEKFQNIGTNAILWLEELFVARPNDWYKPAAGVYSLSKLYTNDILNLACKRALFYNVMSYRQIRTICEFGLYLMPIDTTTIDKGAEK